MSLITNACIEFNDKRKICVAFENGKAYTLNNHSEFSVRKVRVDKCLQQGIGEKRCDFLMSINDEGTPKRAIYIELKGGDLNTAINQVFSTVIYLKAEFVNYRIDARIVGSRDVPNLISTADYRKLAKQIIPTGGTIERGTNRNFKEDI